jgi:hypothetical protein
MPLERFGPLGRGGGRLKAEGLPNVGAVAHTGAVAAKKSDAFKAASAAAARRRKPGQPAVKLERDGFSRRLGLSPEVGEIAWGMLAEALRAASGDDGDRPVLEVTKGETRLRELLRPFSSDLQTADVPATEAAGLAGRVLVAVERALAGQRTRFPFGELALDAEGRVREIRTRDSDATVGA